MRLRRQLPVYSPITATSLLQGTGSLIYGPGRAESSIRAWLAREFGVEVFRLTDSGTSALGLALGASAAVTNRPVVLLPAYGCYDLVTAALAARVRIRFYDVDPETLGPDWTSLTAALSNDTAAVLVAHWYGIPVELARVRILADRVGAILIEDAAQGIGGSYQGRALGSTGDFGVLSFGRGKGVTSGGGGALLANTAVAITWLRSANAWPRAELGVRGLLASMAQWILARPSWYGIPSALPGLQLGETVFHPPHAPHPMSRSASGLLSQSLRYAARESEIRRTNAASLAPTISAIAMIPQAVEGSAGYLRLPVVVEAKRRPAFRSAEAQVLGIMPGYPRPLPELPVESEGKENIPGARQLSQSLFTLPTHSRLSFVDLSRISKWAERLRDAKNS